MNDDEPPPDGEDEIVEELKQLNKKEFGVVDKILKLQNAIEGCTFFLSLYANASEEKQWLEKKRPSENSDGRVSHYRSSPVKYNTVPEFYDYYYRVRESSHESGKEVLKYAFRFYTFLKPRIIKLRNERKKIIRKANGNNSILLNIYKNGPLSPYYNWNPIEYMKQQITPSNGKNGSYKHLMNLFLRG
ncbi:MAG: hypothetical protein GXO64_02305 [Candidatus Micrarchaeota archaeon]|nr:hypothetical protein [Candidatus Micrarchaeota archaeon]